IERESFRYPQNQPSTKGAPGSPFEPGSCRCLLFGATGNPACPLFSLPNLSSTLQSNEKVSDTHKTNPARRVPQVRRLNLGLAVAFSSVRQAILPVRSSHSLIFQAPFNRTRKFPIPTKPTQHEGCPRFAV